MRTFRSTPRSRPTVRVALLALVTALVALVVAPTPAAVAAGNGVTYKDCVGSGWKSLRTPAGKAMPNELGCVLYALLGGPLKRSQAVAFTSTAPAPATTGATYRPTATATSGLPVVITLDSTSRGCTIAGGLVTFTAVGTCVINADQPGNAVYVAAPRVKQSVAVAKTQQTIAFTTAAPSPAAVGATYRPSASSTSGLSVTIAKDSSSTGCTLASGLVTFTGTGTCVLNADQTGNANFLAATRVKQSIFVTKTAQTVAFTSSPADQSLVGATYTPTATATSGLPVTITRDTSSTGCTIASGVVTFTGAGSCVLAANQAGNATYAAAPQVAQTIQVLKKSQSVAFTSSAPAPATVGGTYTPTASSTSTLPAVISLDSASTGCSLSGGTVTFTGAGTCILDADQAGDPSTQAAVQVTQTISVVRKSQTVSFTSTAPTSALAGADYTPTAAATSGLSAAIALASTSTGCTIADDGKVTITGVGTCVITADQAGDATYDPAAQVTQSISVVKATQTISFTSTAPSGATVGGTYTPTASATSGLGVSFALDATSTGCTLESGVLTFTAAGTCAINADQAGNNAFSAAPQVNQSFAITVAQTNPTAVNDSVSVPRYSTGQVLDLLGNDDPGRGTATITSITQPSHGTATLGTDGSVNYVPATNYCNTDVFGTTAADTFTYTLTGGSTATVSVKVVAPNDAPAIATITSKRGTAAAVPIVDYLDPAANIMRNTLSILINAPASDPGACRPDSLTVSWGLSYDGAAGPYRVQGITGYDSPTLNIAPNALVLAPNPPGVTFTYIVTSGVTGKESRVDFLALVTQSSATQDQYEQCQAKTAQCVMPVLLPDGLPATAFDDIVTVPRNSTSNTLAVRTNDTSDFPDPRITAITEPAHGTVTVNPGAGTLNYVPDPGYCNSESVPDTFTYTLNLHSTATVKVTVPCE